MFVAALTLAIAIVLFWWGAIYLAPLMLLAVLVLIALPFLYVKDLRHRRAVNRRYGRKVL